MYYWQDLVSNTFCNNRENYSNKWQSWRIHFCHLTVDTQTKNLIILSLGYLFFGRKIKRMILFKKYEWDIDSATEGCFLKKIFFKCWNRLAIVFLLKKKGKNQMISCRNCNRRRHCRWYSASCKYTYPIVWSRQKESLICARTQIKPNKYVLNEKEPSPLKAVGF